MDSLPARNPSEPTHRLRRARLQFRLPILGRFEVASAQLIAGLLLLLLAAQAAVLAWRRPALEAAHIVVRMVPGSRASEVPLARVPDSILMYRAEQAIFLLHRGFEFLLRHGSGVGVLRLWLRLPPLIFALWLGGALWWVSRRLFNNYGGYVALGLFTTSPALLELSARVNADILAAWGLFGAVYTAIGVAHTLYAPPRRWPRVVLLGLAFGFTAAAHLAAGVVALALAAGFMLYLAPGRRRAAVAVLAASLVVAAALVWALYGFGAGIAALNFSQITALRPAPAAALDFLTRENLPLLVLLALALIVFMGWRRARYFGNFTPLLVLALLLALGTPVGRPEQWALPFAFVLVAGVFSDLFETRLADVAVTVALALLVAQEFFCLSLLAGKWA